MRTRLRRVTAASGCETIVILLCYDGSADARAAIDRAGLLMPGVEATVLVIWETILESMSRNAPFGMGVGMGPRGDEGDASIRLAAFDIASTGAKLATEAGLIAQPRLASRDDEIAAVILAEAAAVNADVIVVGTRGLGPVKSLVLGSVSQAVLHDADRPVLVVPSPSLAERRRRRAEHAELGAQ